MKIRNKIFAVFVAVVLITLSSVFFVMYFFGQNRVLDIIIGYNSLLAKSDLDNIDRVIYRRLERWKSYIHSNPELLETLKKSNADFDKMSGRDEFVNKQDETWKKSDEQLITSFMRNVIENPLSDGLRVRTEFYNDKYGYDIFPEFFITNKYGAVIAATGKTSDYLQSDEDWWTEAVETGMYVSDVSYDESTRTSALNLCLKIEDQKGDFLGVAKVVYNIQDIFAMVKEVSEPLPDFEGPSGLGFTRKTVNAFLFNKDGQLIYSLKGGFEDLQQTAAWESVLQAEASENNRSSVIKKENGVEKMYSHTHSVGYSDFKGLGWVLVISKDTREVLAPLQNLILWFLFFSLISFTVVIVLAFALSGSLVGPIKRLIESVKKVEGGDLDVKIDVASRDEIGYLARLFNSMVLAVKKSRREVDEKVKAQTADIKRKAALLADQQKAILNVLEDVEEEKDLLAKAKSRDEAILSGIGDGVFVLDANKKIAVFNPMAEKISGFSAGEAVGKKYDSVLKFIFEKDGKVNDGFVKEAMEKGKIAQMANHTLLVRKNGEKVPVADSAAPVRNAQGKIFGCVVVFRDVTKEREIDKMKSEFVSVASHQLRTPLTGIKWFSELLLKSRLSATTKDYVKQIAVSNERMVRLVDDLLNVSRIETGKKFDIVLKEVDVVPIVKNVMEEQMPAAKEKGIALSCAADAPHKLVLSVDELKMRQVFQNLVSNALKYSKEKTNVILGCQQKKDEVIFYVKDQGVGIPKHQQNQVFNKFFRAENVLTLHTDGTGLGLYIVKAIVEAHGGRIWFESVENKGTTFFFSLPRRSFNEGRIAMPKSLGEGKI